MEVVSVPSWTLVSAFRYALGRSSYIVADTIDLLTEPASVDALTARGWHELVAEEIHQRVRTDPRLYQREAWERLADRLAPHMREECARA